MRRRQPHRLILRGAVPPVVLSFWTAQAAEIAKNGAEAERLGHIEDARNYFALARDLAPADDETRRYCNEHATGG